ncbi:hypothetical protein RRJ93_002492 [Vibrio parahaemolyticus]|nr:hypothetical protein [Vibrio parahaemolyticus]ELI5424499.1 hypothetical protein [Vibrio parahaemolyticus]
MPYYNGRWHRYSEAERREYGRQQREIYRQEWHKTWISKTGLKQERNWTDAMIKSLLEGKEQDAGKIKAYKRTLIARVEKTKKFQAAMAERVARQKKKQKVNM